MLYNSLREYKDYLLKSYSPATAETYYKRLSVLLRDQPVVDTANRLELPKVLEKLSQIKYKNYFSQSKNALLHFCEFAGVRLSEDSLTQIATLANSTKKKYRKLKPIEYSQVEGKIKHLRNQKLKLSFQTMMATGLHVSELSGLYAKDCALSDDSIVFHVIGKGGKSGTVMVKASDSPKLYGRLKALIEATPPNKKIFYSTSYLQQQAKQLGFTCHDLRRAFAKLEYQKCRNKAEVSEKFRHSNIRTTNIYLRSKVKI